MRSHMPPPKRQRVSHQTVSKGTAATMKARLTIENFYNGETVHQRCIIIKGIYSTTVPWNDFVTISSSDGTTKTFPPQTWPLDASRFKAIAFLSPGKNILTITRSSNDAETPAPTTLTLNYIPLLQTPALHLAIMVAKDSPLLIDCPPSKYGRLTTAHSSLDAAVAKMRMAAYMWQALTAEDMRMKGLGRRSFRLEEEFAADTTSQSFMSTDDSAPRMQSTAKVHIIRSSKTVAELRGADIAQQNEAARNRDKLFDYFLDALASHGAPFEESSRPVVAGMLLDAHFSTAQNMILGHAALGCHNPEGVSLGMMGSHLAYSFPRFLEEVTECLRDTRVPGRTVGNDNGECATFWEACCVGQGAFLHEVGHAFGAPHTTGIMARGYPRHWARNFLTMTARAAHTREPEVYVDGERTMNDARWDLRDALSFRMLPHFWLPGDKRIKEADARTSAPVVSVVNPETDDVGIEIYCVAGIAAIEFNGEAEEEPSVAEPYKKVFFGRKELENRFDPEEELKLHILGMNGKSKTVKDLWRVFASSEYVRIPGSDVVLRRRSVVTKDLEESDDGKDKFWSWATLLTKKTPNGKVMRASSIDVRTGCILDGAYVKFPDGTKVNCGPRISRWAGGDHLHEFGGHAAEDVRWPKGEEIVKIQVAREDNILCGMRIHFENGKAGGALSGNEDDPYQTREETLTLEVQGDERIMGFYGRSWWGHHFDGLVEFGIITAPKGVELPDQVYKMKELQNTDGGQDAEDLRGDDDDSQEETQTENEDMC
ncbi:putative zinc metalloproteinase [Colletotrichum sp. SAR 10_86]|nr:putative zinc metalloproteinase [Colletotrichum sp. SAR 10_86]